MPTVREHFIGLETFLKKEDYKGWDPFDGLNSSLFQLSIFKYSRFFRLLWLQFFKISPINLRRFLGVPKEFNPKGLGLVLTGYCNKYRNSGSENDLVIIRRLV